MIFLSQRLSSLSISGWVQLRVPLNPLKVYNALNLESNYSKGVPWDSPHYAERHSLSFIFVIVEASCENKRTSVWFINKWKSVTNVWIVKIPVLWCDKLLGFLMRRLQNSSQYSYWKDSTSLGIMGVQLRASWNQTEFDFTFLKCEKLCIQSDFSWISSI